MFLALRRYAMDELAALYAAEPGEFRLLATIGRRLLTDWPLSREMIETEDRFILQEHGVAALRRIRECVEELREQVGDIEGPWPTNLG